MIHSIQFFSFSSLHLFTYSPKCLHSKGSVRVFPPAMSSCSFYRHHRRTWNKGVYMEFDSIDVNVIKVQYSTFAVWWSKYKDKNKEKNKGKL